MTLVLHLSGEIDEAVDFDHEIGETDSDTLVHCKEISRLSSHGTKAWVHFFSKRTTQGTRFRFAECSPVIVEQLNLMVNFLAGGAVESIYVPFICTDRKCKKTMVALFPIEELRRVNYSIESVVCKKCGKTSVLDEHPQEYFLFAQRRP
jgi:hypothetical protein